MAYNAIADVTSLNAGLTSIANAIRSKGGTTASLAFPSAFISAVNAIKDAASYIEGTITSAQDASLSSIPDYAFTNCSLLSLISFPACTTIGSEAFIHCYSLKIMSFPACTTIGDSAFNLCRALTAASFPKCTTIGYSAFGGCTALTTAFFPKCTIISRGAFYRCIALTTVSFPVCTIISEYAFYYCSSLTTVSFPKCTRIAIGAFSGCVNLVSCYLMGSSVVQLNRSSAFASTPIGGYSTSAGRYGSVFVPASLLASYKAAINWSDLSSRIIGI